MDKLEKFIKEHRQDFDIHEPSSAIWNRIAIRNRRIRTFPSWLWQAAAAIAIFAAAWYLNEFFDRHNDQGISRSEDINMLYETAPFQALAEAEAFYTTKINSAREEISGMTGIEKSVMDDMNTDILELDRIFEELKNDLKDDTDNEEVVAAMIQNYRIKLEILEELLTQLKKAEDEKGNEYNGGAQHEI